MRKCDSCGYLLLAEGAACKHCGAALQPATVGAAAVPVAPAAPAAAPSAPPAPGLWSPRAAGPAIGLAPPPPPRSTPPVPDFWQPPTEPLVKEAPPRSGPSAVTILILIVAVVVGFGTYRVFSSGGGVPSGAGAFASGHGVDFSASDGSFSAQFPSEPRIDQEPITVGPYTATILAASVTTDSYELGAASMTLPMAAPADRVDSVLDDALNGGISQVKGDLVNKQRFTRGGLPALEATFKAPDGYSAHALVMLASTRLYILFVHAKSGTEKLYTALDKSFVPHLG